MLKIEVIKFEAQDVITASTAAPAECICDSHDIHYTFDDNQMPVYDHGDCQYEGTHNCSHYIA